MDFREFVESNLMFQESKGVLKYGPGIRAVVMVDQGISDLYRKLCPKYLYVQPPMYPAHITVVRTDREVPKNMDFWNKYEDEVIPFSYERRVYSDNTYVYLRVTSDRIGDIREELGLPRYRFGELGSDRGGYHITIGNFKKG